VSEDRTKIHVISNPHIYGNFVRNLFMWKFLFINNLISNYKRENDIIFMFKCMPYLISVFKIIWFFGCDRWWHFFITYVLMFCKCKRWRWSQPLCLSIQFITSLMLSDTFLISHFFILAVIFQYIQHATLIPTLQHFSAAHLEKHQCLLTKSLIMCKGYHPYRVTK
jgi:hypothetical protein